MRTSATSPTGFASGFPQRGTFRPAPQTSMDADGTVNVADQARRRRAVGSSWNSSLKAKDTPRSRLLWSVPPPGSYLRPRQGRYCFRRREEDARGCSSRPVLREYELRTRHPRRFRARLKSYVHCYRSAAPSQDQPPATLEQLEEIAEDLLLGAMSGDWSDRTTQSGSRIPSMSFSSDHKSARVTVFHSI